MKILYGIQGTGNGHLSRAKEIIPHLNKMGSVELLISGTNHQLNIPFDIKYKHKGISFFYNQNGGLGITESIRQLSPIQFTKDLLSLPLEDYDLIISDFEPLTAYAGIIKNIPVIGLGHQQSFTSADCPRPKRKSILGEMILKHYAPASTGIGFHFKKYDAQMYTPVIRSSIRQAQAKKGKHVCIYLPAFDHEQISLLLSRMPEIEFHLFSGNIKQKDKVFNIRLFPADKEEFEKSFTTCCGVICGAGFETPAEALYLEKKLMIIPIKGQYEQQCNAESLKQMGVPVFKTFGEQLIPEIYTWYHQYSSPRVYFPDDTSLAIEDVFCLNELIRRERTLQAGFWT